MTLFLNPVLHPSQKSLGIEWLLFFKWHFPDCSLCRNVHFLHLSPASHVFLQSVALAVLSDDRSPPTKSWSFQMHLDPEKYSFCQTVQQADKKECILFMTSSERVPLWLLPVGLHRLLPLVHVQFVFFRKCLNEFSSFR